MKKKTLLTYITNVPYLAAGGILYAMAYTMFLVPGSVFTGGVGGIGTVWEIVYGWSAGLVIFLLNVPLVVLFTIFYGWRASIRSIIGISIGTGILSLVELLDILPQVFQAPMENRLLCALFGGITLGAAIGLFFTRGFTTGGTDIIALLLKPLFKKLSTARLILLTDLVVIVYAAIMLYIENNTSILETMLYSFVAVFVSTTTISVVTGGFDKGGIVYIFSKKNEEIANEIVTKLHRGVTILNGMGWYTKSPEQVILCLVKKSELYQIKLLARSIDPKAFMIVGESTEAIGEGFKENVGDAAFEQKETKKPGRPKKIPAAQTTAENSEKEPGT